MKRLCIFSVLVCGAAFVGAAQESNVFFFQNPKAGQESQEVVKRMASEFKIVSLTAGAMGAPVKGAPYSAVEVSESSQTLADGTRIHNENRTSVYRDGEGRVRRETPDEVTIWDPTTGTTIFLDTKNQTARKSTIVRTFGYSTTAAPGGVRQNIEVRMKDGLTTATVNGEPVDPATLPQRVEVLPPPELGAMALPKPGETGMLMAPKKVAKRAPSATDSLGTKVIEGLTAEGTRAVTKLDTGAIGNDRPIEITSERWYSPELQTVVMTRRSDPRTGEEIFRLTNVNRAEPPAYLFQVPPGFQVLERK